MRFYSPEYEAILQKMVVSGSVSLRDLSMPKETPGVISFLDMENRDQLRLYVNALHDVVQNVVAIERNKIKHTIDHPDATKLYVYDLTVNNVRFLMVGGFHLMHKKVFRAVAGIVVAAANMIMNPKYEVPGRLKSQTDIMVNAMMTVVESLRSRFVGEWECACPNNGSLRTTAKSQGMQFQSHENNDGLYVNLDRIHTVDLAGVCWNGDWDDAVLDEVKDLFLNPPDFNTSPSSTPPAKKRGSNGSPGGSASRRKPANVVA